MVCNIGKNIFFRYLDNNIYAFCTISSQTMLRSLAIFT